MNLVATGTVSTQTDHALSAFQAALKSQGLNLEILECSSKKLDRVGNQSEKIIFIKSIIAGSCRHFWALDISDDFVHSALIAFHKLANLIFLLADEYSTYLLMYCVYMLAQRAARYLGRPQWKFTVCYSSI